MAGADDSWRLFVTTYAPLASSRDGREASCQHKLPPFIDGSIRREPDLQHKWPSISCLCRAGKFAPRLKKDDVVVYLGAKQSYGQGESHWRLTAVLRVARLFDSHKAAAVWYRSKSLCLPSNCMVPGNGPMPLEMSHKKTSIRGCVRPQDLRNQWDKAYWDRVQLHPEFVVCKPLFRKLSWKAPVVRREDLVHAFGCVPASQNPTTWPITSLTRLMLRMKLPSLRSYP